MLPYPFEHRTSNMADPDNDSLCKCMYRYPLKSLRPCRPSRNHCTYPRLAAGSACLPDNLCAHGGAYGRCAWKCLELVPVVPNGKQILSRIRSRRKTRNSICKFRAVFFLLISQGFGNARELHDSTQIDFAMANALSTSTHLDKPQYSYRRRLRRVIALPPNNSPKQSAGIV